MKSRSKVIIISIFLLILYIPLIAQRSGLHFTAKEIEIWKRRAQTGPFKLGNDAFPNSPADWQRITTYAEKFKKEPSIGRWYGPMNKDGNPSNPVLQNFSIPPQIESTYITNAAFVDLVMGTHKYSEKIKKEILAQANVSRLNFKNKAIWKNGIINDVSPGFGICSWLTRLLYAYDYLGKDKFTKEEQLILKEWFISAAEFFQTDLNNNLSQVFDNKRGIDLQQYKIKEEYLKPGSWTHWKGYQTTSVNRRYNNRRASIARYIGLVGIYYNRDDFKLSAKNFVKEWLAYGIYPDGTFAEFERSCSRNPSLGISYTQVTISACIVIADAFARKGDFELYNFSTRAGTLQTRSEKIQKSLLWTMIQYCKYVDGSYKLFASCSNGSKDHSFIMSSDTKNWKSISEIAFSVANLYYQNDYIQKTYLRKGKTTPPYPSRPAGTGIYPAWMGDFGTMPGVLFMYGNLEGKIYPYKKIEK